MREKATRMIESVKIAIDVIGGNVLLERLAVASIEVTVLGAVVWIAIQCRLVRSPRVTAYCWLLVLAKAVASLAIGPVWTAGDLSLSSGKTVAAPSGALTEVAAQSTIVFPNYPSAENAAFETANYPSDPATFGDSAVLLWFGAFALMLLVLLRDVIRTRRLAPDAAPQCVQDAARDAAKSVGCARCPRIWQSDRIQSAALIGYVRPKIVVPAWTPEDAKSNIAWVLRHELTHLRRRDHLANALRRLAQALFFFHPVVWYAGRQWEEAAELACDAALAETPQEAREYAQRLYSLLLTMRDRRDVAVSSGLYASRTQVGRRIEAILSCSAKPAKWTRKHRFAAAAAAAVVLTAGVYSPAESESRIIGGTEDHAHTFRTELEERYLTYAYAVKAVGTVGFSKDHESVTSMSENAQLECRITTFWSSKTILLTPNGDEIDVAYAVNGKTRPLNDTGRYWLRRLVKRIGVHGPD